MSSSCIPFGMFKIHPSQAFFESKLVLGIVNIKPIVPGHVLVIPKRVVARFGDLTKEEVVDLWLSVHAIGPTLEKYMHASALNIAIQDGAASGQSVPHVHVHLLPRKEGDFARNDDIYELLEKQHLHHEFNQLPTSTEAATVLSATVKGGAELLKKRFDDERRPRTLDEMAAEASLFRTLFPDNKPAEPLTPT